MKNNLKLSLTLAAALSFNSLALAQIGEGEAVNTAVMNDSNDDCRREWVNADYDQLPQLIKTTHCKLPRCKKGGDCLKKDDCISKAILARISLKHGINDDFLNALYFSGSFDASTSDAEYVDQILSTAADIKRNGVKKISSENDKFNFAMEFKPWLQSKFVVKCSKMYEKLLHDSGKSDLKVNDAASKSHMKEQNKKVKPALEREVSIPAN